MGTYVVARTFIKWKWGFIPTLKIWQNIEHVEFGDFKKFKADLKKERNFATSIEEVDVYDIKD